MKVVVFDWDDTLYPTTPMNTYHIDDIDIDINNAFDKIEYNINKLMSIASKNCYVCIITNASKKWVLNCITDYIPGCSDIMNYVTIYSTVDTGITKHHSYEMCKTIAFQQLQESMFKEDADSVDNHHIISFGDSPYDRDATLHLRKNLGTKIYIKNVKLHYSPSITSLIKQQELCIDVIKGLIGDENHIDVQINHNFMFEDCSDNSEKSNCIL